MTLSAQTRMTLVCSIISAIVCGSTPGELIFWIPGLIFGVLFAIVNIRGGLRFIIYAIASGAIYIGAVQIFFRTIGTIDEEISINGGFLAGLFGAVLLALATKVIGSAPIKFVDEGLTALLGAILGVIFIQIVFTDFDVFGDGVTLLKHLILAFVVWQVPISWLLTYNLQRRSRVQVVPSMLVEE